MSQPIVEADHLSKSFSRIARRGFALSILRSLAAGRALTTRSEIIRDITFSINEGDRLAVIGNNGAGKTTLLRLMCGILPPSSGRLEIRARPSALFKCWLDVNQDLAIEDNARLFAAFLGIPEREVIEREESILERAGIAALRGSPLKILSEGQQQRLAFSVFMSGSGRFIILDETLNALDQEFQAVAHAYLDELRDRGATVVMTSHNLAHLQRHCNRGLWLEDGRVRMDGPIDRVAQAYEASRL